MCTPSTQAKCADIDSRLSALYKDQQALSEKIAALQANADKINPAKKKVTKDVVRLGSRRWDEVVMYFDLFVLFPPELFMLGWKWGRK